MLLSMTGHGEGRSEQDGTAVAVEVRTVNSRYFKLSFRASEGYSSLEPRVESVVRQSVRRGTVQLGLRVERQSRADDYRLNDIVLASYVQQLQKLYDRLHMSDSIHIGSLLELPGVLIENSTADQETENIWPLVEAALNEALSHLAAMRTEEGQAMEKDLAANCASIERELLAVAKRAPAVVEAYGERLTERINKLLAEHDVQVAAADVVREIGIFAERSDIAEEIVRLRSHLEQFSTIMKCEESSGRKLDFLIQEMFRETNTIGSKANDAEIARHVVEMKTYIDRMREMIQNIE